MDDATIEHPGLGAPVLSIVIPTRGRRDSVLLTLESLVDQDWTCEPIEVIIVVDGQGDGTAQAVRARELPLELQVVEQEHAGVAAARNRGARLAAGEWLLFLDDDVRVQPGYLAAVTGLLAADVDVVLTRLVVGDWVPDSLLSREVRGWHEAEHQVRESGRMRCETIHFPSTAIRKTVFEQAGGFDESFTAGGSYGNEDVELGHRLLEAAAQVRYCPEAVGQTGVVVDTDLAMRREYQVGHNDVALVRKHPDLAGNRFGLKFENSRTHRILAPIMLSLPLPLGALAPLRALVRWLVRREAAGATAYRIWFAVRAMHYWRGVRDAGGRDGVNVVRHRRAG